MRPFREWLPAITDSAAMKGENACSPPTSGEPVVLFPRPEIGIADSGAAPIPPPAKMVWSVLGQSVAKPSNDSYRQADDLVLRKNEDRHRVVAGDDAILAAVSDGAGSSGMFCGAWAETLVGRLPQTPLSGVEDLNRWMEEFWEDFSVRTKKSAAQDAGKLSKFVREGSYATLAACWLRKRDDGVSMNWLGYGDSPIYVFDRSRGEAALSLCDPAGLAALERDPHLLNWKTIPKEDHLRVGAVELTGPATVVLASDGIGQFVLMRYLADACLRGTDGAPGTDGSIAQGLVAEYRRLVQAGKGKLADMARTHLDAPGPGFAAELAALRAGLGSEADFSRAIGDRHGRGLMANDDATMIVIDIDRRIAGATASGATDDAVRI